MDKSRITGLLKYLTSITLGMAAVVLSVMLVFQAPTRATAQAKSATVATLKQAVSVKPLPTLTAKDFDVSRTVKVVVAGKLEPKTIAAPAQTGSLRQAPEAGTGADLATAVVTDAVNLRAAASKQSARVYVVQAGSKVTVHETERSWTRITTEDGITGWLASKFLDD